MKPVLVILAFLVCALEAHGGFMCGRFRPPVCRPCPPKCWTPCWEPCPIIYYCLPEVVVEEPIEEPEEEERRFGAPLEEELLTSGTLLNFSSSADMRPTGYSPTGTGSWPTLSQFPSYSSTSGAFGGFGGSGGGSRRNGGPFSSFRQESSDTGDEESATSSIVYNLYITYETYTFKNVDIDISVTIPKCDWRDLCEPCVTRCHPQLCCDYWCQKHKVGCHHDWCFPCEDSCDEPPIFGTPPPSVPEPSSVLLAVVAVSCIVGSKARRHLWAMCQARAASRA